MSWSLDELHFSRRTERAVGRAAWALAWFGLVAGQLHAMARHATPEGKGDLESAPLTRMWSVPASEALSPLLTWSDDVYTVYRVYGLLWIPVYTAYGLCALVVRSHRRPVGWERWGWRLLLTSYAFMTLSIVGDYLTPWTDQSFAFLGIPSAVLGLVGAPVLGVALLRRGFRPRVLPWVLVLQLPIMVAIVQVTSLGSAGLPEAFAWAYVVRRMVRSEEQVTVLPEPDLAV
jgi:hypothetical protein